MKKRIAEKCVYIKYALFHPFDGFYEIRFREKGSGLIAGIMLLLFGVMFCVDYQYTGFVMNPHDVTTMSSLSLFSTVVLGFVLFIVSNWSVTTLLNGKGDMKNIMIVCGYSLIPLMLTMLVKVIVSNFIIEEEIMILNMVVGIGVVWFLFLMIAGLCTIHEYGLGKTVASIVLTFVAAAIIMFLAVLFFTLIEQMITFIISVVQEFVRRL